MSGKAEGPFRVGSDGVLWKLHVLGDAISYISKYDQPTMMRARKRKLNQATADWLKSPKGKAWMAENGVI